MAFLARTRYDRLPANRPASHVGVMTMRSLVPAAAVCLLTSIALTAAAYANQITLGLSTPASPYTLTGDGAGDISGTVVAYSETATFDGDVGSATFGAYTFTAGPATLGVFPITSGGSSAFGYSAPDGDTLTGAVKWTEIDDGSLNPHMLGTLSVATISGDPAFTAAFGPTNSADFTFETVPQSLDALSLTTGLYQAGPSAGEIVGNAVDVREPGSLGLILAGIAILGVGGIATGRIRAV